MFPKSSLRRLARSPFVLVGLVFFAIAGLAGVALAQGAPPAAADPTQLAINAADTGAALLQQYGPIWGAMYAVFGVASNLLAQAQSRHWIAQGRTLALLVAGVGLLGSVLEMHFNGGQWAGVVVTGVLGIFKVLNPNTVAVPQTPAPAAAVAKSGPVLVSLLVAIAAVGLLATPSCSSWSTASSTAKTAAKGAVIDCTKKELQPIVAEFVPVGLKLLQLATGADGKVDWSQVADASKGFSKDIGGCVLAETVAKALNPPPAKPGAPASSPLQIDTAQLRADFDAHRAQVFGGATYKTASGDL